MDKEILKLCFERGCLLDKEVFEVFNSFDKEIVEEIIKKISTSGTKIITKSFLSQNVNKIQDFLADEKKEKVEKLFVRLGLTLEISKTLEVKKQEKPKEIQKTQTIGVGGTALLIENLEIPKIKLLKVEDFVKHFRNRFSEIRKILQERNELNNLVSIDKINNQRQAVSIIGIVSNKRTTKNKNILLEVEDSTGRIAALVNQNKTGIYEKAKGILLDDIIGIKCSGSRDIVFVNDLVYPDCMLPERKKLKQEVYALFTSDLHVGSKNFLEENFLKFIDWINGGAPNQIDVKKIKYLFITGDTIDGVGVYPRQEEQLAIKDVRKQYEKLSELLNMIRKDVKIIMCPGQHDAVRVAEPQPMISERYGPALYELDNLFLVPNPATIKIKEDNLILKILMYHGASMHSFINDIESLRLSKAHDSPARVVKEMLKRRHLAPTHSSVVYIPSEKQDNLLIKEIPDIITTGEVHRFDLAYYNNIQIICSSCWQRITPFEEKVGNHPLPCKVPLLNLKTRAVKILDFS